MTTLSHISNLPPFFKNMLLRAVFLLLFSTTTSWLPSNPLPRLQRGNRRSFIKIATTFPCVVPIIAPTIAFADIDVSALKTQPGAYRASPTSARKNIADVLTILNSQRFVLGVQSGNLPYVKETILAPPISTLRQDLRAVLADTSDASLYKELEIKIEIIKGDLEKFDGKINAGLRGGGVEGLGESFDRVKRDLEKFSQASNIATSSPSVTTSLYNGSYTDPVNHPGGTRQITVFEDDSLTCLGGGGRGEPASFKLSGRVDGGAIFIDFSPKGGPKDFEGRFDQERNGERAS